LNLKPRTVHPADYLYKLAEHEVLGILEYWIVDYLAVGAIRDIGSPKTPTVSVYILSNGEYQLQPFRGGDRILSITFPELVVTAAEIFEAAGPASDGPGTNPSRGD